MSLVCRVTENEPGHTGRLVRTDPNKEGSNGKDRVLPRVTVYPYDRA